MHSNLQLSPLTRLLTLNTEISEIQSELMHQPFASVRIGELQDDIDRRCRTSLTTCWLTGGYELESDDDEWDSDWEDDLASAD